MSNYKKAIIALIITNSIWGAGSPIFKWSIENGISPLMLAFCRFLIPTIVLLFFFKKMQRPRIRDTFYFVLLGVLGCTFNIGLYFLGLQYAPSINQPIIGSSGPIFIIFGSALFLGDRATKKILLGNLIGLTGILFIVLQPFLQIHQHYSIVGNVLFILATISAALGTLISKKLSKRYNTLTLTFWTFFIAALTLLPIPFDQISYHGFAFSVNFPVLFGIFFGGIGSSLLGYLLFYWGMHYINASETTIFTYVDPVIAVLIAAPLLHEYPNLIFLLGSFLVFFGIYIAEGRLHWHPLHKLF